MLLPRGSLCLFPAETCSVQFEYHITDGRYCSGLRVWSLTQMEVVWTVAEGENSCCPFSTLDCAPLHNTMVKRRLVQRYQDFPVSTYAAVTRRFLWFYADTINTNAGAMWFVSPDKFRDRIFKQTTDSNPIFTLNPLRHSGR